MENEYEKHKVKKKNKFFLKKWLFWIFVILNWILGIVVSKNYSVAYIVASFFGSFILFFVLGLLIWMIIKVVKKIMGMGKDK